MNDEVRDMIGKALDNEPPIGIDYGTVRADGRRRLARRHLGIVGGAALAVVAVAGVAVTVGQLNASPSNEPGGGPPTTSTSVTPAPGRGCVVPARQGGFGAPPDGVASDDELAESARLTEAFGRYAIPLPAGVTMEPAKPQLCAIEETWGTQFTLRSPAGERAVYLEVRPRNGQPRGDCNTFGGAVKCTPVKGRDGSEILISETPPVEPNHPTLVNVDAWRPDGTVVRILETGSVSANPAPRVLDDAALVAIATAPELKVNWATSGSPAPAEPSDRRAAELSVILAKADRLPPGMRATQVPQARAAALAFYVSQGGYKLDANLVDAEGTGSLFINLSPPGDGTVSCGDIPDCELITLPDGRKATWSTQPMDPGTRLMLTTTAADGTQITIMVSNQAPYADGTPGTTRPQPPLTRDDMIRIASIPDLGW